jgi:hypothetical protein
LADESIVIVVLGEVGWSMGNTTHSNLGGEIEKEEQGWNE